MRGKKLIALILIVYIFGIYKFFTLYKADVAYIKGKNLLSEGDANKAEIYLQKAIKLNPNEPRYHKEYAKDLAFQAFTDTENTEALKEKSLANLQKAQQLNPLNLVTLRNNISLYYLLAAQDQTNQYTLVARDFYNKLKETYPNDAGVWAAVAKYERKLNLKDEYRQSVERIEILRPDLLEWQASFQ